MVLQRGPFEAGQGLPFVHGDAVALIVHHAAVELRVRAALLRGPLEPLQSGGPVDVCAQALVVHQAAAVLRGGISHLRRLFISGQRVGIPLGRVGALRGAEGGLQGVDALLQILQRGSLLRLLPPLLPPFLEYTQNFHRLSFQ